MIETERLILRSWREADTVPFYAMGQDAEVMRYLGPPRTMDDAISTIGRVIASQAANGFCFWAVERKSDAAYIGFCGLQRGKEPIDGEIEIGWRLARAAWGQGFAYEAAQASLDWGWANLDAPTIAAITAQDNTRSWRLMERLGMRRVAAIDDPDYAPDDSLHRGLLYRIDRPA